MKAHIKQYPCLLAGHAVPAQGAAEDAAWPRPRLSPAEMQTLSSHGSRHTGDALGGYSFCFPQGRPIRPRFSSVAEPIYTHSTSVVSVPKFGKKKIQALLFLLWEEQKVSDMREKSVGES